MNKLRVLERQDPIHFDEMLDGLTLDDAVLAFQKLHDQYAKEIFNRDLDVRFATEYYGYDGGMNHYIKVWRWETDKEYQDRIDFESMVEQKKQKAKEARKAAALKKVLETEAEERQLYEQLKRKFEDG